MTTHGKCSPAQNLSILGEFSRMALGWKREVWEQSLELPPPPIPWGGAGQAGDCSDTCQLGSRLKNTWHTHGGDRKVVGSGSKKQAASHPGGSSGVRSKDAPPLTTGGALGKCGCGVGMRSPAWLKAAGVRGSISHWHRSLACSCCCPAWCCPLQSSIASDGKAKMNEAVICCPTGQ